MSDSIFCFFIRKIQRMSSDRDNEVIQMYINGTTMNQIAKILNCNSGTVYYILKKNGVETKSRKKFNGDISEYEDRIKQLYLDGNGSYKISKLLGISKPTVLRLLSKHFDISVNAKVDKNNLLKDKSDTVIELFNQGKSSGEIAKIIGHSNSSVWDLMQKLNLDTSDWKIKVDETFFEVIDSPNKAYVLGWMFSDGCVTDEGKVRLSIHEKDISILEKIREIIKYEGQLLRNRQMVELCINRKKMVNDLIKLGCTPRKSLTLQFPKISLDLLPHFMRGCYDGDGSILNRSQRSGFYTCITSSSYFVDEWSKILTEMNIAYNTHKKNPEKPTSQLFTTRMDDSIMLCKFLYKDAEIFLERKYIVCQPYI